MDVKKIKTEYMLYQEVIFDNIDDMLDMKSDVETSYNDVKDKLNDMVTNYRCEINDNIYKFTMMNFFKYGLN